jgi:hypothetical protein
MIILTKIRTIKTITAVVAKNFNHSGNRLPNHDSDWQRRLLADCSIGTAVNYLWAIWSSCLPAVMAPQGWDDESFEKRSFASSN